jgi:hypothetical protein
VTTAPVVPSQLADRPIDRSIWSLRGSHGESTWALSNDVASQLIDRHGRPLVMKNPCPDQISKQVLRDCGRRPTFTHHPADIIFSSCWRRQNSVIATAHETLTLGEAFMDLESAPAL